MASREIETDVNPNRTFSRAAPATRSACSFTQAQVLLLVLLFCALHAVLRWTVSETAGIDDVDQVLRAQIWSWGYGPQPPLYTWLSKLFLGTFGYSVLSMLLLKESLVFAIYELVYGTARRLTGSQICALVATALLEANPSIAWEAHRELTHTVLVSACSVALVYCFVQLSSGRWSGYVWFGLVSGLGMLAKYNFAIIWAALVLGGLCVRQIRPLLLNRKMILALVLALAVCAPHFWWFLHNQDLAFSSVAKLKIVGASAWGPLGIALGKWVLAILAHVGLMLAAVALLFGRSLRKFTAETPTEKALWAAVGWILIIVTINLLLFRVTGVRDRYVQPMFVWLPVLLAAAFRKEWTERRVVFLLLASVVGAVVILLVAPGRVLLTERLRKNEILNTPFEKLARDLAPVVAQADCVIGENHPLAGNLRLWFPDKLVLDPEVGPLFAPSERQAVLVWDVTRSPTVPWELLRFAQTITGKRQIAEVSTVEELLKYHHQRSIRLGVAVLR